MTQPLSGAQIDKLGDRLRQGPLTLDDLRHLRLFLNSLEPFSEYVFSKISNLDLEKEFLYPAKITRRRSRRFARSSRSCAGSLPHFIECKTWSAAE
jgi:hypothetical protein